MSMFVEVAVNGPCCSGCGACAEMAPEIFAVDEFGKAVVLQNPCPEEPACRAARSCPDECIEVIALETTAGPACP